MNVYFISGLGADCRIFDHISLPNGFTKVYLDWIKPIKRESLEAYAIRLAENIEHKEKFVLIGLSMGGMVATEIAAKYQPKLTILISSVPSSNNLPARFKTVYKLRLHKLVPISLIKAGTVVKRLFTIETQKDKALLRRIIKDSDPVFIRWAMNAILEWDHSPTVPSLYHIHGSRDEILPLRFTKPSHIIDGGTHMMVITKATEINNLINEALVKL